MQRDDRIRLKHMLDAARETQAFVASKTRTDLDTDRKLTLALVKCIEVIGEAASRVSVQTRDALSAIPWGDIIGMRNRLIHGYFAVNLDIVWSTATEELPFLIVQVETALS